MGFPPALDRCAEALGIPARKDQGGHKLMLKMCRPRLVSTDGSVVWWDAESDQIRLGNYCKLDVEVERAIGVRLRPMSHVERAIYILDQKINDRGIPVDHELVDAARTVVGQVTRKLDDDVCELTQGIVANTRQCAKLLNWISLHSDLKDEVDSIDRYALAKLLKRDDLTEATRTVLTIRQEAAKSSTAKLIVMQRASNRDGRIRGLLRYCGARQTGRWAGHLLQPQNFPRGHINAAALEAVVQDVKDAARTLSTEVIEIFDGSPLDVISSLLRGCISAAPGKTLLVADFNAIEARVLAWLAGATALLNTFRIGGDPYRRMAAKVYACALEAVTTEQRWLGKQLVLSCGYQCGWKNFQNRIAKEGVEINDCDAREYIKVYRIDNPEIVGLWEAMGTAAKNAIRKPGTIYANGKLRFGLIDGMLYMKLPGGRLLAYRHPMIESLTMEGDDGPYQVEQIAYWGVSPKNSRWTKLYTYGGKLTENAVQAISRDVLAAAMLRVEQSGYPIVLHVHDEIVAEIDSSLADLADFTGIIAQAPAWLCDCPIKVEGWQGARYRK
jgi:DNA polymerase